MYTVLEKIKMTKMYTHKRMGKKSVIYLQSQVFNGNESS